MLCRRSCLLAIRGHRSSLQWRGLQYASHKRKSDSENLVLDILDVAPTRRETRLYRDRLGSSRCTENTEQRNQDSDPAHAGNAPAKGESPGQSGTHVAVMLLEMSCTVPEATVHAIGRTLAQLNTLGMTSVVVMEDLDHPGRSGQAERLTAAISKAAGSRAQLVDHPIARLEPSGDLELRSELIESLLRRRIIPVLPSRALAPTLRVLAVPADQFMLGLIQLLARQKQCVDRVLLLNSLGGIPARQNQGQEHIYINLQQEFDQISTDLGQCVDQLRASGYMKALRLMKKALGSLPPTSSGFITSLDEVANLRQGQPAMKLDVQTRRRRNPLIHNLLTDKPAISSSLPRQRAGTFRPRSTFLKHGMPVRIIAKCSQFPIRSGDVSSKFCLSDLEEVDINKLMNLLEASFRRSINREAYLRRLEGRAVGLVIAGDYDGCAILTEEMNAIRPMLSVPYLDKFAVLPKWQGTGVGVADIIFKSLTQDIYPDGICWRSRANNAINKWYFERARGSWQLSKSQWTCFWTHAVVTDDHLKAFEAVCRATESCWQ